MHKIMLLFMIAIIVGCSQQVTDPTTHEENEKNPTSVDVLTFEFSKRLDKILNDSSLNTSSIWEFQVSVTNPSPNSIQLESYDIIIANYVEDRIQEDQYTVKAIRLTNKTIRVPVNKVIEPASTSELNAYFLTIKDTNIGKVWILLNY